MARFNGNVRGGSLALRQSASTGASRIDTIPNNTALQLDTCSAHDWFYTEYNGQPGYVLAQYIAITNDGGTCTVNSSGRLNIRKTPSSGASSIYQAEAGSQLRLLDNTTISGWWRVSSSEGTGWAVSSYLQLGTAPGSSGGSTSFTPELYAIANNYCELYKTDVIDSTNPNNIYCTIPVGTRIPMRYCSEPGNYHFQAQYNGYIGYVSINSITVEEDNTGSLSYANGSTGASVIRFKRRLYQLRYHPHEFGEQFTGTMMASVKIFQQKNGLTPDGIIGSSTRAKLNSTSAAIWSDSDVEDWIDGTSDVPKQWFMGDDMWRDFPWPSTANGNETIGNSGNSITAMAMLLSTYQNRAVTPVELAEFTLNNGFRDPNGNTGVKDTFFTQIENYTDVAYEGYVTTVAAMKAHVDAGGLAIAYVTKDNAETYTAGATQLVVYRVNNGSSNNGVFVRSPNANKNPSTPLSYSTWVNAENGWFVRAYLYSVSNG